ncbi:MAG: electron transport complex subunit RsxC [Pseudomonadota bacterium]|nr:electron transport complex subunit RsxC [Pseudomonadota bacterium]
MKLFPIRGGVRLPSRKATADQPIQKASLPPLLRVPMNQHIGVAAEPVVKKGDRVRKGQQIGASPGGVSSPIHAPTSGEIVDIANHTAPHPSGLAEQMIMIRPDDLDEWAELPPPLDPSDASPSAITERIHACGVVGMGGATFPTAAKLDLRSRHRLRTLVINGAECEPYISVDDRLMRERTAEIVDGIAILRRVLDVENTIVAIEDNKPAALAAIVTEAGAADALEVAALPSRYPAGSEKHLALMLTGRETPSLGLPADVGVIVHNVATVYAVHQAVRLGRPLISRVVTVGGGAVRRSANLEVLIGTPIGCLFEQCGGFREPPTRVLLGGPMMGQAVSSQQVPVTKGVNGVLALEKNETTKRRPLPCIRCGQCIAACPCGLEPLTLAALIRKEKLEAAAESGLYDCVLCGSCAYVCPSHIPLVQYYAYAKGRLFEIGRVRAHQEELSRLTKQRQVRLERLERERAEARARRKAAKKKPAQKKLAAAKEIGV